MGRKFSLNDKYTLAGGTVYMTGIQALVRLPLEQMRRDRLAGLKTGAMISGYEGSPLGGYDIALERVRPLLDEHNIHFIPGVNEDLAATSIMGSQTYQTLPGPKVDGVVGIWYGKGPGVDRSGDALRHANLAGTGEHCGALAIAGDDHVSKSSTIPHQSEWSFYNFGMPTLSAGNTQEVLDYGLIGIAMSRFSGAWTGLKLVTDVCDGGGTVEVSLERLSTVEPELFFDGEPYRKMMNSLLIVPISLQLERELHGRRLAAAREFAKVNGINEIKISHPGDRLGIVTAGKSYYDLRTALRDLGVGDEALEAAGIRILKLAMVYPLEESVVDEFVAGLDQVVVIEEKRAFIEMQLRELLFNRQKRPAIHGKTSPDGQPLFPAHGELNADIIARGLAGWLPPAPSIEKRLAAIAEAEARSGLNQPAAIRTPSYCSGCPHNRSTFLLEGQIAGGGIGCHGMAARLDHANRGIAYIAQMGGEGAAWIGMAPFTEREHLFQNIGDGTYFHSGRTAVNAAIASGVNITYKILYNGSVAMTGGQQIAGGLSIPALTRELEADGVKRIVVVTDDVSRYADRSELAPSAEVRPREELEQVLAELEKQRGASVMIYDQMCAAEKRRRRTRGKLAQPVRRMMIHERVCEGCGDCVAKSNCVSLYPVETEFGAKTRIHQSSCNADYTCALGDCPSFVSVMIDEGAGLKKNPPPELPEAAVEEPARKVSLDGDYHILMPGIGGTGVVTINALLAAAALIEDKHAATLDQTGLSQKGGSVVSHLTISGKPIETSGRISYRAADLLLGFDIVGAASAGKLKRADPERTVAVVNSYEVPTAESIRQGLTVLSADGGLQRTVNRYTRSRENIFVDASKMGEALFGSHLQSNVFLLGVAYQAGWIPLEAASIEQAIRLNGVAVETNLAAFRWGRKHHSEPESLAEFVGERRDEGAALGLDALIDLHTRELTLYQDAEYAERYRRFVADVRRAEQRARPGAAALSEAAARGLYKLMAYKDEYEVARLLTDGTIEEQARAAFTAPRKIIYHLHPPLLRSMGLTKKLSLGPWFKPLLRILAALKLLRGTAFDVFGWAAIRRQERELIGWYRGLIETLLASLSSNNLDAAVEIAGLADKIRGYEHVKLASIAKVRREAEAKLSAATRRTAA